MSAAKAADKKDKAADSKAVPEENRADKAAEADRAKAEDRAPDSRADRAQDKVRSRKAGKWSLPRGKPPCFRTVSLREF